MTKDIQDNTVVLYNTGCPVCRFEIEHYAAYSRDLALPISFDDLNDSRSLQEWQLDADTAARKLHVIKNGELLAGIPAFIALWQTMPRYQWMAIVFSLPVVHRLACWTYDCLLAPSIYRLHLRRARRKSGQL